jgi:hypothetical protein
MFFVLETRFNSFFGDLWPRHLTLAYVEGPCRRIRELKKRSRREQQVSGYQNNKFIKNTIHFLVRKREYG